MHGSMFYTYNYVCTMYYVHTRATSLIGIETICDRILENGSKSHIKSIVFQHVFLLMRMYFQAQF